MDVDELTRIMSKLMRERPDQMSTLGGRLRLGMAAHGIHGATALGLLAGKSRQTAQKWLDDRVDYIEPKNLFLIAKKLELSESWLSDGKGAPVRGRLLEPEEAEILDIYNNLRRKDADEWRRKGLDLLMRAGRTSRAQPFTQTEDESEN